MRSAALLSRNFQLLNLGLGIGAVVGGLVVHVHQPGTFVAIYLIDGSSNLVVVAALALLPQRAFGSRHRARSTSAVDAEIPGSEPVEATVPRGYRAVLADGLFRRYGLMMTVLMTAGYAAINTGYVGFATLGGKSGAGDYRSLVRGEHVVHRPRPTARPQAL